MGGDRIKVVVAMDFADELVRGLAAISPRLQMERHFPQVPANAWADVEVLYAGGHIPQPEQAPRLRWIQLHGAGANHLQGLPILDAEDVAITSASGIHATPIAEHCLAMMLAFACRLPHFLRLQAEANWDRSGRASDTLRGQTLGIVGYGSIGRELARLADSLGMTVVATRRDLRHPAEEGSYLEPGVGDPQAEIPTRLYPPQALASMLAICDYVALTLPLTGETQHLLDEGMLATMKPGAVLINISRGAVLDEAALISALAAQRIAGAALDVFEEEPLPATSPLWSLDNVIITPHIAGNTRRYHEKAATLFAENLRRYLNNEALLNLYDRSRGY
ncbi:MAG: D-2-hydroxyacid dehydrogenase [Anaerolineae bacterium]|nr:D-2-hydroxyacid dehydrogenase [Anaerolineae bacterium]